MFCPELHGVARIEEDVRQQSVHSSSCVIGASVNCRQNQRFTKVLTAVSHQGRGGVEYTSNTWCWTGVRSFDMHDTRGNAKHTKPRRDSSLGWKQRPRVLSTLRACTRPPAEFWFACTTVRVHIVAAGTFNQAVLRCGSPSRKTVRATRNLMLREKSTYS